MIGAWRMHGGARGSRDDPPGRLPDAPVAHAGQGSPRDVVAPEDDEVHDVPFDAMVAAFRPREGSASTSSGVRRPPMPSEDAALHPPAAAAASPLVAAASQPHSSSGLTFAFFLGSLEGILRDAP